MRQPIQKERDSNFELLRLLAMFCIVAYHLLGLVWHNAEAHAHWQLTALTSPLHVGVPVFVIISGWFGIRPSWRGVLRLLLCMALYYVPVEAVRLWREGAAPGEWLRVGQFFSQTPYWFMQTYLWLYLVSPAVNLYLKGMDGRHRMLALLALGFATMYVGCFGNDPSLHGGKNVLHFVFLYLVGDTMRHYRSRWERLPVLPLWGVWLVLQVGLVLVYPLAARIPMNLFFPYNSLGILLNSMLLVMLFARMRLRSRAVNRMASSSFAIYLLHGQPTLFAWQMAVVLALYERLGYGLPFLLSLAGFSVGVMAAAVAVDQCLMPLYVRVVDRMARRVERILQKTPV